MLDKVAELGPEASRRCAVDDVVIDGHGQIDNVADLVTADDARSCAPATHNDLQRHERRWRKHEPPASRWDPLPWCDRPGSSSLGG